MAFKMRYGKGDFPFKKTNDNDEDPPPPIEGSIDEEYRELDSKFFDQYKNKIDSLSNVEYNKYLNKINFSKDSLLNEQNKDIDKFKEGDIGMKELYRLRPGLDPKNQLEE